MVSAIKHCGSPNAQTQSKNVQSSCRQLRHTFLPHQLGWLPGTLLGLLPSKIPWPIRAGPRFLVRHWLTHGGSHGQILSKYCDMPRHVKRIANISVFWLSRSPDFVNDHPHRHARRSVLCKFGKHSTDPVQMNHPHINPPMPVKHGWMYLSRWFDTFEIGNLPKHMVIIPRIAEFPSHGLTTFDTFEIYWW